jgi:hypothetical protein
LINNPPESQIVKIWQNHLLDRTDLITEEGEPIRIIYPGRINDGQGADLLDAVIATSQGLTKGDIEVHVKSSGWRAHCHHQDPAYNQVMLHVVMWRDTEAVTKLEKGGKVSTLALDKHISGPDRQWTNLLGYPTTSNLPCHQTLKNLPVNTITELLDNAGAERFLAKATSFQADLAQTEASQSLYQGIMGALGYSRNKLPFLELAHRLPLQVLESLTQRQISDEECLARQQALLLGTAGLLPSQHNKWHQKNGTADSWLEKLEKLWVSSHRAEVMSENDWHLFKVRPNNSPVRRIVAITYLILQYRTTGILEGLVNKIKELPMSKGCRELVKALLINTKCYWMSHFDLDYGRMLGTPTLLGGSRAADIAVNVLLPFTHAWGKLTFRPELAQRSFELYRRHPKLLVNAVEKHMGKQLGLNLNLVNSAQRQQGLIHVYKTLCSQGKCRGCPLVGEAIN